MQIKDLIKRKDYDYICWRIKLDEEDMDILGEDSIFFGVCRSENGGLISMDGDTYSEDEEVLSYEEWSKPEKGIMNGLTVVVTAEWIRG